jgi:hypothetical protein
MEDDEDESICTPETVKDWVESVRSTANGGDSESAHIEQDSVYLGVLRSIASGRCSDPQLCAAEALKIDDIDFARWYA